jgi:hypothetical protein
MVSSTKTLGVTSKRFVSPYRLLFSNALLLYIIIRTASLQSAAKKIPYASFLDIDGFQALGGGRLCRLTFVMSDKGRI